MLLLLLLLLLLFTNTHSTITTTTGKRWNGMIYIADDTAILDASMDLVSAKKVRNKLKAGESISNLVGTKMSDYFILHKIREKMIGVEEWEEEEKLPVKILSKNAPALSPTKVEGYDDDDNSTIATATIATGRESNTSPSKTTTTVSAPIKLINMGDLNIGGNNQLRPTSPLTARSNM